MIAGLTALMHRRGCGLFRVLIASTALLLAACGGGGGGGGPSGSSANPPRIQAGAFTFPSAVAAMLPISPNNTALTVRVDDAGTGAAITNATVTVNGTVLAFSSTNQLYQGGITLAAGGSVSVEVIVAGKRYDLTANQLASGPTIVAPASNVVWSAEAANVVTWGVGAAPSNVQAAFGVLDTAGNFVAPSGGFTNLSIGTTTYTLAANTVSVGNRLVLVGNLLTTAYPNAAANSALVLSSFSAAPITVIHGPASPTALQSLTVSPAAAVVLQGGTRQLGATGVFTGQGSIDLSAQATWTSSKPGTISVSASGLVSGLAPGTATITAQVGPFTASLPVNVFTPNPSPATPLSQSVGFQVDPEHTGFATVGGNPVFPSSAAWSRTLVGNFLTPLIAGGKVFVVLFGANVAPYPSGDLLYALDEATGNTVWGPVPIGGSSNPIEFLSYDHGTLFVLSPSGMLLSFDGATGSAGLSVQLDLQTGAVGSPPIAANGLIFVSHSAPVPQGGMVQAIDQSTGGQLWSAVVPYVTGSSPTLTPDGVVVNSNCDLTKLAQTTGSVLWQHNRGCVSGTVGGAAGTTAYANGKLVFHDYYGTPTTGEIYDAATGNLLGTATAAGPVAFAGSTVIGVQGNALIATDANTSATLWSQSPAAGDYIYTAPLQIDNTVVVGTLAGNVLAFNASTGASIWQANVGQSFSQTLENAGAVNFNAGDGYLVAPAGGVLTAWKLVP